VASLRSYRALSESHRRLERERSLLQAVVDVAPDAILLTNTDGGMLVANASAENLFASREDEREGRGRAVALNNMLFSAALAGSATAGTEPDAVDDAFARLHGVSRVDPSFDRVVLEHVVDLAPPGLDELLALLEVLVALRAGEAAPSRYDMVVLDTAPNGHTLRLLGMPGAGLEWVRAFMALWLKYRKVMGIGEFGWDLVSLSRDLRELPALLGDPERSRAVVVTRPAELPAPETRQLIAGVHGLGIALGAVIVTTVTANACRRCRDAKRRKREAIGSLRAELSAGGGPPIIDAPMQLPPPRGARALRGWERTWRPSA
jgi:anion-transporting  ArsA/GET3 family ATPase